MKRHVKTIFSLLWLVLGLVLIGLSFAGKVDSFWNGLGSALLVVGALQLLRGLRLSRSAEYREKMQTASTDERNHFLRNKAWAWAGYLFVLLGAVGTIVLRLLNQPLLSSAAACAVCVMLLLYSGAFFILQKKY